MVESSEATIFTKTSFTVLISFLSYLSREILFDPSAWQGHGWFGQTQLKCNGL